MVSHFVRHLKPFNFFCRDMGFKIGKDCQIDPSAIIDVREGHLGDRAIVKAGAVIEGRRVEIGREAYIDRGATIGGGSCFDPQASLHAGDWFHMGVNSQVNIARGVEVGHEVGIGIETKIFTHGAYVDAYNVGAPVQWGGVKIGDHVWLPNAWVNPDLEIGSFTIVAARSLVHRSLPSGCFAAGVPVKILREKVYPKTLMREEKESLLNSIADQAILRFAQTESEFKYEKGDLGSSIRVEIAKIVVHFQRKTTHFHIQEKIIEGDERDLSIFVKDQLRRNGIRFRYQYEDGTWTKWTS